MINDDYNELDIGEDIPAPSIGRRVFGVGQRVKHRYHEGRLGTVRESDSGNGVRVDWDMLYGETLEDPTHLESDAPLPDPAYALARAARFRRQRDRALEDLAKLAGMETEYAVKFGEQGRQLEDARAEMEAAYNRQAKVLLETQAQVNAVRELVKAWREAERPGFSGGVDTIEAIGSVVDKPTGE